MNGDILAIVEQIESDKEIDREILLSAIESALLSAARRVFREKTGLSVLIDRKTGNIVMNSDAGQEAPPEEFGRIAAQAARQVITQKIREAEKDHIHHEYTGKIGEILTGAVHRIENNGVIIVDLGKAEGILPPREQNPREDYRQGDRIRAYLLDVRKGQKGPEIILSRTHPGLVRKLFELEVPEIYEKIVEIKAISRTAGERTKIAVTSNNEKVDPVGACVGVKGQRVKSIVRELEPEKIDIVRWNADIKEYIKASLAPAIISEIRINEGAKEACVLVADDQLPLAIGRHGQNVRLASKLVGWKVDVRKKSALEQEEAIPLDNLDGVGPKNMKLLAEAGFKTVSSVASATSEQLMTIQGIGSKTAEKIIQSAKDALRPQGARE